MNKAVEAVNSPAVTMIYRGAMMIAVLVIGWFANEFLNHKEDHGTKETELAVALTKISASLDRLEASTSDRYTASDAKEDQQRVNERITTLARSMNETDRDLKSRVRALETSK